MGWVFAKSPEKELEEKAERFSAALKLRVKYTVLTGCCGFHEIYGWENINYSDYKLFEDKAVDFLSTLKNFYDHSYSYKTPGALVTTVNHHQLPVMEPIFKRSGFSLIQKGYNKKTDNRVFLFSKIINPAD